MPESIRCCSAAWFRPCKKVCPSQILKAGALYFISRGWRDENLTRMVAPTLNTSGTCSLALVRQTSKQSPCIHNVTFGCHAGRRTSFWVKGGCRGIFACAAKRKVSCGDWRNADSSCACEEVLERSSVPPRRTHIHHEPPSELTLLIAIVASSDNVTQQRTLTNMRAVDRTRSEHRARVDWAVVAYDDRAGAWERTRHEAATLHSVSLV